MATKEGQEVYDALQADLAEEGVFLLHILSEEESFLRVIEYYQRQMMLAGQYYVDYSPKPWNDRTADCPCRGPLGNGLCNCILGMPVIT